MSRPIPIVLLSATIPYYQELQVLLADAVYGVFFEGSPISIRKMHTLIDVGVKYKRTSFAHPAHAHNLAQRLNKQFQTDGFYVCRMDRSVKVVSRST